MIEIYLLKNKFDSNREVIEHEFLQKIYEAKTKKKFLGIKNGSYGKPYFINNQGLHFNITHSGKIIAIALANFPLGIDIEQVRPIDIILENSFTKEEQSQLKNSENNNYTQNLLRGWTFKESYLKLIGKGLMYNPLAFSIDFQKKMLLNNNIWMNFIEKEIRGYYLTICVYHSYFLNEKDKSVMIKVED